MEREKQRAEEKEREEQERQEARRAREQAEREAEDELKREQEDGGGEARVPRKSRFVCYFYFIVILVNIIGVDVSLHYHLG